MKCTSRVVHLARTFVALFSLIGLVVALDDSVAQEATKIKVKVTSSDPQPNPALTAEEVMALLMAVVDDPAFFRDESIIDETTWIWKEIPKATKGVMVIHDPGKDKKKTNSDAALKMVFDTTGKKQITVMVTVTIKGKNQKKEATTWTGSAEVSVEVLVADIVVNFDKPEVRPGIAEKRWETVKATVRRKDKGGVVKVDLESDNPRAKISPASFNLPAGQTEQSQEVTVMGVQLSTADRDAKLFAKAGVATLGSIQITVVEPRNWTNNNLGKVFEDKKPTAVKVPGGKAPTEFGINFRIPVEFTVQDQFEKTLRPQWAGVLLFEGLKGEKDFVGFDPNNPKAGSPINAKAMATDPVQFTTPAFLTEAQAKAFADGTLKLNSPAKTQADIRIVYKVDDGKTTYMLLGTNHRVLKTTLNFASMTNEDTKEP